MNKAMKTRATPITLTQKQPTSLKCRHCGYTAPSDGLHICPDCGGSEWEGVTDGPDTRGES
jgi:primosomal protein N'